MRDQKVSYGIEQYRQIGYTEWTDYYNRPFVVKSQKILNSSIYQSLSKDQKTTLNLSNNLKNSVKKEPEIMKDDRKSLKILKKQIKYSDNRSDSDLSFEYDKKKVLNPDSCAYK